MWDVSADPLDFEEAIAWFRARVPLSKDEFGALEHRARRRAFTVAGVADLDLLNDTFRAIDKAIAAGTTFETFVQEVGNKLYNTWGKPDSSRLETIFTTNVLSSYSAGRWRQLSDPDVLRERPMWMFDAVLDGRVTDLCRGLDGTTLPADDPWWETHHVPLHFRCRSGIISLTEEEARARGVTETPPKVPAANGFGLAPDKGEWEPDLSKYPAELQAAYSAAQGGGSGDGDGRKPGVSEHPTDNLIRELIGSGREASAEEVARIVERVATVPFNDQQVRVAAELRGLEYLGRTVGSREDALYSHLVKRVLEEKQWAEGTTADEYLADLRRAIREPSARITLYTARGGSIVGVFSPNIVPPERRGPQGEALLYVAYSADRGKIISGYMASSEGAVRRPEGARWLK